MSAPAKVLVTGGAGFIGSHLCERLVERGDHVVVVDNVSSGRWSNLGAIRDRIEVIEDDVLNLLDHREALAGTERIYHLAALISGYDSLGEPDAYVRANVDGLLRVVDLCRTLERPRVVFASSSTVYGSEGEPLRGEATPPRPITMYALTKLMGEHVLAMYRDLAGFSDVSLRLFNVYGPRQSPDHPYANVTCKFSDAAARGGAVKLYGDGKQTRDFVYVDDVVDAMLRVSGPTRERVYNVGTGTDVSIGELLQLVQRVAGTELRVEQLDSWPNDIRAIRADVSRIHDELSFEAKMSLAAGLARTVRFFRGEA
ncbi:MAG: NAD-dependent epimerase/dehydratase family protein [Myxococcota bacterium]|nr:NAD-dependent epimerase/dehydratase family protein [Myxococcota bacterium]